VAIRPTRGAFDWLPASAVQLSPDRKRGEIIADKSAAFLGSNVKQVEKHVSQLELKSGQSVQVIGEKSTTRGDGTVNSWLKIAPPAEEVRWVQIKHLSTKSPEQLAAEETADRLAREDRYRRENAAEPGLLANVLQARDAAQMRRDDEVERAQFLRRGKSPLLSRKPRDSSPRGGSNRAADEEISTIEIDKGEPSEALESDSTAETLPRDETPPRESVRTQTPRTEITQPAAPPKRPRISLDPKFLPKFDRPLTARDTARDQPKQEPAAPAAPAAKPAPAASGTEVRPIDSEEFKKRLTELDVELTTMVAQDSSKWNLLPLRQAADELVEHGASPLERGQARLVLERIVEFEATLPPGQEAALAAAQPAPAPAAPVRKPDFVTQYDAVGYLMPIVGARPGTPQFQLTDKDGRSLSLVSAAPGVNLHVHIKKQVGVYGHRGYVESLKKQHVMAERIVDLDIQRR
jgi:hypothetical protein